jgi:uncharacterized membrane protein YeaQ/YmgE (transglycosylase-associated protein family)
MALADVTVNFTLSSLAVWLILGAFGGLVTGQLMKSKGKMVLGDLLFGLLGGLIGVYAVGPLLRVPAGGVTQWLLAIFGGVVVVVLVHFVMDVRRRASA